VGAAATLRRCDHGVDKREASAVYWCALLATDLGCRVLARSKSMRPHRAVRQDAVLLAQQQFRLAVAVSVRVAVTELARRVVRRNGTPRQAAVLGAQGQAGGTRVVAGGFAAPNGARAGRYRQRVAGVLRVLLRPLASPPVGTVPRTQEERAAAPGIAEFGAVPHLTRRRRCMHSRKVGRNRTLVRRAQAAVLVTQGQPRRTRAVARVFAIRHGTGATWYRQRIAGELAVLSCSLALSREGAVLTAQREAAGAHGEANFGTGAHRASPFALACGILTWNENATADRLHGFTVGAMMSHEW